MPASNGHTVRRSSRVPINVPIRVTSMEPSAQFSEVCETLVVSAHGCALRFPVQLNSGSALRLQVFGFHRLAAAELAAVEFREEILAFTLELLCFEVANELAQQPLPERPQLLELVEHQRLVAALRLREALLEGLQHFLDAGGRAFLLLDPVLEALDFLLRVAE